MKKTKNHWKLETLFLIIVKFTILLSIPIKANASYWLVIGSYRQGPGVKPQVSGITSPSLFAIPIETLDLCVEAGKQITKDIYKPVWQFDNRWTCIYRGDT